MSAEFQLADEAATASLAARAAAQLPATGPFVIYLQGDLGAGKTSFARGLLAALGEAGPVRSPTYGLLAEYATLQGSVVHVDLYRLRDHGELAALGLADYLPDSRLWLIEWPERAGGQGIPDPDVRLQIQVAGTGRRFRFEPVSESGLRWVAAMTAGSG